MNSLNDTTLECNPYTKINFDGGDLSSDAGLLLIKEFAVKIGLEGDFDSKSPRSSHDRKELLLPIPLPIVHPPFCMAQYSLIALEIEMQTEKQGALPCA